MLTILLFSVIDVFLVIREAVEQTLNIILLLQTMIIMILVGILLLSLTHKIVINKHSITQSYRGIFRYNQHTIPWKDIIRVEGEFGVLHIGDKITLYISHKKMKTFDIIKERDRIIITNMVKDFKDLVSEVIRNASNAHLDKELKKFTTT